MLIYQIIGILLMVEKVMNKVAAHSVYAVDLFCGAGGLTCGLEKSGISVNLGIDIDPACEYPYSENNNADFLLKSIDKVSSLELDEAFGGNEYRLLAGCAPCQTFSKYNQKADASDKRWWLLQEFERLIKECQPELVTMENVPGLMTQQVFFDFVDTLKKLNYHIDYQIVNCADYGLPQQRNRLVLLASRLGAIKLLKFSELNVRRRTVHHAINKLPPLRAGEVDPNDPLHSSAALNEINLERIKASKPGGTWHDWPEELVAACHKKKSGKGYRSVYGRMRWDAPAPTITTQYYGFGNGRFGHPEQDRAISLREGAIFQGFPKKYKFIDPENPVGTTVIGRMIGNAVPVKLGEIIGKSVLLHISEYKRNKKASPN